MFMPLYYASDSLSLLFFAVELTNLRIWWDLLILVAFSLVLIIAGILLFKKYGRA